VLAEAFRKLPDIRTFQATTCADVWAVYVPIARAALNAEPEARAPVGGLRGTAIDAVYLDNPLLQK